MRNSDALRIGRHQLKTFEKRQGVRYTRNTVRIHSALSGDNYLQNPMEYFLPLSGTGRGAHWPRGERLLQTGHYPRGIIPSWR
jgi:hypothetical protein